jgi:imidazolonepropionase-like amidohydrolase
VAALAQKAHQQGLKVWSHATIYPAKPSDAVAGGVDVLSHAALVVWEPADRVPERYHLREPAPDYRDTPADHPAITKVFDAMKEKGCLLDTTVTIMQRIGQRNAPAERKENAMYDWTCKVTAVAHRRGVPLAAGTDNMGPPGRDDLPHLHEELAVLVEKCGLKPAEALTAATRNGARALGAEADLGTIANGKLADLVVLTADPTGHIKNTRKIDFVIKGGHVHRRK